MKNDGIVLHGGGLDSTAMVIIQNNWRPSWLPVLLHIDYGQVASEAERSAVKKQSHRFGHTMLKVTDSFIPHLNRNRRSTLWGHGEPGENIDPVVLGRNAAVIMHAAVYNRIIWLGLDKPDSAKPMADCTEDFLHHMSAVLRTMSTPDDTVWLRSPHIRTPKLEVYQQALEIEPRFFDLAMTCWRPRREHNTAEGHPHQWFECGACAHCTKKAGYMQQLGLKYKPSNFGVEV